MAHFYTEIDGNIHPRHFVPMAKDPSRTRPSTISDARKAKKAGELWFPSVTTILNILDKPALVNWKVDQHLQTAYDLRDAGIPLADWIDGVKTQTRNRLDEAPQAGTDCHKLLEDYFTKVSTPEVGSLEHKICFNVEAALIKACGRDNLESFDCEKYFSNSEYGYAGCADLSNKVWVIDYKTKQTADKFKPGKMAYPEHARQLAAYGMALCDVEFRAANIFICLETGDVDFHEHSSEELDRGWLDFMDCLSIYQRNIFNPLEAA